MASKTRRRFTAEYKTEAVARLSTPGATLARVAKELGISAAQRKSWWLEREAAGSAEAVARQQAEARAAVFEYIEIFDNRRRSHSALDYQTPAQARTDMTLKRAA